MTDKTAVSHVEKAINYTFSDKTKLIEALTHSSFCNENPAIVCDNERLEFLGDAVVSTVIAARAYELFPEAREGDLTRYKAAVVSEPSLAERGREIGLGPALLLGKGAAREDRVGESPAVLADAFEALIGAIYLDGGFSAARSVILAQLNDSLETAGHDNGIRDAKSALQVHCLKEAHQVPRYRLVSMNGPSHAPTFTVEVTLPDLSRFTGTGSSKKSAEQSAAGAALAELGQK